MYWCGIYTVITYLTTLHQYHLPRHLHIDVGFIFLSPTEPHYTITYPSTCIWVWVLYYGHLRKHLYFDTVFTFLLLLSQPATYIWRRKFNLSPSSGAAAVHTNRGVVVSTWQVEPTGLQKRWWREEVLVLTTSSLRFICHPLEDSDKKTHRGEMEVLVNKNETSLDSVFTSIPSEVTFPQSDGRVTFRT